MPSIWLFFADKLTFEVTNERIFFLETSKNRLIHRLDSFFRISDTQKFKTKQMKGLFLVWTAYEIDWSHLAKHVQFPSTSNTPNLSFFSVVFGNAIRPLNNSPIHDGLIHTISYFIKWKTSCQSLKLYFKHLFLLFYLHSLICSCIQLHSRIHLTHGMNVRSWIVKTTLLLNK